MSVTYAEVKKILSQYVGRGGKCPAADDTDLFCKQVLQQLLYSGQHGNIRKFCFKAQKGCVTVPFELETPLKVKIDGDNGFVWNKWFTWNNISEIDGCLPASVAMYEEPGYFPTVYDIPDGGTRVGVLGTANEADDAHVIVQGTDVTGRDIFTVHNGQQIHGEYVRIRRGELRYTTVKFGAISSISKTATNGYVQLLWVKPDVGTKGFLADYSPLEEHPQYRRYKLTTTNCGNSVQVSILGRIRLKEKYADNDLLPFDNLYAISLAGQMINKQYNDDVQVADAKSKELTRIIEAENEYKRGKQGNPIAIEPMLSGGHIKNII